MHTSVQTLPSTEFYRRFVERVRETVAPEQHTRAADTAPTGAQLAAAEEMMRLVLESPDPAGTAGRVLHQIEVEKCTALAGQCVEHDNDFGETIHSGPESSITVGECSDLMPFRLRKWGNDKPYVTFGWDGLELDLAGVDAAIEAERAHLAALVEARAHLAAVLAGGAR